MRKPASRICRNCGIDSPSNLRKGFCPKCYGRYRANGDPNKVLRSRLLVKPNELSEQQTNVLIGLMLGDGHLERKDGPGVNANLTVTRSLDDVEYLRWQHSLFRNICTDGAFNTYKIFDNRTNRFYHNCKLETARLPLLTEYHKLWYTRNGDGDIVKILPDTLALNAEIIAHWIADDGHIALNEIGDRLYLTISTNSFSRDEVYRLQGLLNERYQEHFTVSCKAGKEYIIRGADAATRTLLSDIDSVFPTTMARKIIWRDILKANLPRFESRIVGKQRRIESIERYLGSGGVEAFTCSSLNKELKLFPLNSGGITPQRNMLRYLSPYINAGYILKHDRIKGPEYVKGQVFTITPKGLRYFQSLKSPKSHPLTISFQSLHSPTINAYDCILPDIFRGDTMKTDQKTTLTALAPVAMPTAPKASPGPIYGPVNAIPGPVIPAPISTLDAEIRARALYILEHGSDGQPIPYEIQMVMLDLLDYDPWMDEPLTAEELAAIDEAERGETVPW